jgi:hypothetical protein
LVALANGLDLNTREGMQQGLALLGLEDMPAGKPQMRTTKGIALQSQQKAEIGDLRPSEANSPHWQEQAVKFVNTAYGALRGEAGKAAWDYLTVKRGLAPAVLDRADIGFNPEPYNAVWGGVEVYLPRGVVIAWDDGNDGHSRIRIRTAESGKGKYRQATGALNGLYTPYPIGCGDLVVLVEGEFDALALRSACYAHVAAGGNSRVYRIIPVATGGTTQGRVLRHVALLSVAARVLVALDDDANGAGDSAAAWWLSVLPNAARHKPARHDLNDMLTSGDDLLAWVKSGVSA